MAFGRTIGIIALACAVWVIYDVFTNNKKLEPLEKILWTLSAIVFSIITAIVYYLFRKKK